MSIIERVPGLGAARADMRIAAEALGDEEVRFLVSSFYQVQDFRIAANHMSRTAEEAGNPHELVDWLAGSQANIEKDIKLSMQYFAEHDPTGAWALSVHGIGPILAAGLLAHIDIEKAPTAGHIWSFAGLTPDREWKKGERRPWNAALKVLCYKIGESFVKTSGSDKSFYGPIYRQRKELELAKNAAGDFKDQAQVTLAKRRITDPKTKAEYEAGRLPAGRLELRARRIAVKLFLSHFHDVLMWNRKGERAPRPYAIEHMGHAHQLECPNPPWD